MRENFMQRSFLTDKHLENTSDAGSVDEPVNLLLKQWMINGFARLIGDDDSLLMQTSTHVVIVFLVFLAIVVGNLDGLKLTWNNAVQPLRGAVKTGSVSVPAAQVEIDAGESLELPTTLNPQDDVLFRAPVPHTIIPDRTKIEIKTYVVEFGDTVFDIALRYGLAPETIMWSNPALGDNPDLLRVGQELFILPVDGVYHQVGGDDTIEGIASTYKVDAAAIIGYELNELDPENLVIQPGQWLVVPGGTKPYIPRTVTAYSGPIPDDATKGSGIFGWPTSGTITQGYWGGHPGLDIAGWLGAPIAVADSGHVVAAGWDDTGYGYTVVVDHGNGFQTVYAHLQAYYVEPGDDVAKGQTIAEMGSTGNSTGPHLHFELRQGTVQRNPYGFLP
jgi:murein DD-endopeptidase MepM/ murein hydrolase activator NlpD